MPEERTVSEYDRKVGLLKDLPDSAHTRPTTIQVTHQLVGTSQTWVVKTVRQKDVGDTVFLERLTEEGYFRVYLPPAVTAAIHRQADSLTSKVRSKTSKATALARKAAGVVPFVRKKKAE